MEYKKLRKLVPARKGSSLERKTSIVDYGTFSVCITEAGLSFLVDRDVALQICHRSWCVSNGYMAARVGNELIRLHDYVMSTITEEKPSGCYVDHVNQDTLDNRRTNLRLVSPTESSHNMPLRSNNKSGHMGVCRSSDGKKWRAYITIDGRQINLGFYDNVEQAIAARAEAEHRLGFLSRPTSVKVACELEKNNLKT